MKICILIRVYDRIKDLLCNLRVIRETWANNDYDIVVVSNGNDKYRVPDIAYEMADKIVLLSTNVGHLKGNSQLLLEGIKEVDLDVYSFIIILEADTWIYKDNLISKYTAKLTESNSVWASARWYDRFYSLATDFAIIKSSFLKNNISIFDFSDYPECHVCNYIVMNGHKFIYIKENMPVQVPSYFPFYPYAPKGRLYVFPSSKMVTHHIEDITGGMEKKKTYFNLLAGVKYFEVPEKRSFFELFKIRFAILIISFLPKRTWFSKRTFYPF